MASCRREPKTSLADTRPGAPDDRRGAGPGAPAHRSTANGSDVRLGAAFVHHFAPAGEGDLQGARRIRLRTAAASEMHANVSRCALARNTSSKGPPSAMPENAPENAPRSCCCATTLPLPRTASSASATPAKVKVKVKVKAKRKRKGRRVRDWGRLLQGSDRREADRACRAAFRRAIALRRSAAEADRAGLSRDRRAPLLPLSRAGIGSVARRPSAAPSP